MLAELGTPEDLEEYEGHGDSAAESKPLRRHIGWHQSHAR